MINLVLIGKKLKKLREQSNLTIEQVANYLEIDVLKIVSIENGELVLTPTLLNQLSYLYFCPVKHILNNNSIVCSNIRYVKAVHL